MFKFLKNALRLKLRVFGPGSKTPEQPELVALQTPSPAPSAPSPAPAEPAPEPKSHPSDVILPWHILEQTLSAELQSRIQRPVAKEAKVRLPGDLILPQLARGNIRLPFGQLRQAAPRFFTAADDLDHILVTLPLGEILARLNPAHLERRAARQQIKEPADIPSPFEADKLSEVRFSDPTQRPKPAATPVRDPAPSWTAPARSITPAPPGTTPSAREPESSGLVSGPPLAPVPDAPKAPVPAETLKPASERDSVPAGTGAESEGVVVPLRSLAESWPQPLRQEIARLNLAEATVAVPAETLRQGLKRGQLSFDWQTIRSWLVNPPPATPSALDAALLELPLKVLAPLYLAKTGPSRKAKTRLKVDDSIPDLFSGSATPETVEPAATGRETSLAVDKLAPAGTPAPLAVPEARLPLAPVEPLSAESATPQEVVFRSTALEGVAGALVALRDGLVVATRVPKGVDGDMLAGFVPQIFHQMSQSTRDLRMGELTSLQFSMNDVSWRIFDTKQAFFAVFSRPGQSLPATKLADLAAALHTSN